jgi:hypothetical protein
MNLFSEQEDHPSSYNEVEEQVLVDLDSFAIEHATPVDALLFLKELQERLKAK